MTTKVPHLNNKLISSSTNQAPDGKFILAAPQSNYYEFQPKFGSGGSETFAAHESSLDCDWTVPTNKNYIFQSFNIALGLENTSATDTLEYFSILEWIEKFKVEIYTKENGNATEIIELNTRDHVKQKISNYYYEQNHTLATLRTDYALDRNRDADDFLVNSVGPLSTVEIRENLAPLLGDVLLDLSSRQIKRVKINVTFASNNNSSVSIGKFLRNATADANIYSDLKIHDVTLKVECKTYTASNMYMSSAVTIVSKKHQFLPELTMDLTAVGTTFTISLNDFSKHSLISGLYVYIYDLADVATYNSVNAMKVRNGLNVLSCVITNANTSHVVMELTGRMDRLRFLEHNNNTNENYRYGLEPYNAIHSDRFVWQNKISFENVRNHDNNLFQLLQGRPNREGNNLTLTFKTLIALSANCVVKRAAEYVEVNNLSV